MGQVDLNLMDIWEQFPCGCIAAKKDGMFYYQPCDPQCKYYKYAMDLSKGQNNLILKRHDTF